MKHLSFLYFLLIGLIVSPPFSQAKDLHLPRTVGLSSAASKAKPSKEALCGTNNAWAMSGPTVASIYANIGKALGLNDQAIRLLKASDVSAQEKLKERFGVTPISIRLTVKPDGRVKSIKVTKSSGSEITDREVVSFINATAPFTPNEFPEPLSWSIEFPDFRVTPDWWTAN